MYNDPNTIDLFFKFQNKEKLKKEYLKRGQKTNENIEIEEDLRQRVLNESLRTFPDNQHLILTRAESNWLHHTKNIKTLYQNCIREGQLRKNTIDEYYSTSRSTKIKDNVIRLSKKLAKLRAKLNRHLKSLGFDNNDIYEITQQLTEFEHMMNNICSIELFTNNCSNKVNILQKELKLQNILSTQEKDALCNLVFDLQRIHNRNNVNNSDEANNKQDSEYLNIQQCLDEVEEFCKANRRYSNNLLSPKDDTTTIMSDY